MELEYIKVVEVSKLVRGEGYFHKLESGLEIAIFLVGEKIYAIDNKCPHMGMPLCEGVITENETLTCRYHQWKFDLKSGVSTFAPNIYLKKYETRVENGFVFVKVARLK